MPMSKLGRVAFLVSTLVLCSCASTPASVGVSSEPTYVAAVEVVQGDAAIPDGFADALRTVVLTEAAFYGTTGRAITVRINLNRVHFKNVLQAMIIGDNNDVRGQVTVVDPSAGQQMASFAVRVDGERSHGVSGGGLAMGVLEVLDPTGFVGIGHAVGSASSADINRSGTAVAMRANFADETLRQTFGDVRTRAVIQARREAVRTARH
jgi:hypothetical protein